LGKFRITIESGSKYSRFRVLREYSSRNGLWIVISSYETDDAYIHPADEQGWMWRVDEIGGSTW